MSDFFRTAYDRARARFTPEQWLALPPRQLTDAIYAEIRRMDAEALASPGAEAARAEPEGRPVARADIGSAAD